jgi:hypothetical protein
MDAVHRLNGGGWIKLVSQKEDLFLKSFQVSTFGRMRALVSLLVDTHSVATIPCLIIQVLFKAKVGRVDTPSMSTSMRCLLFCGLIIVVRNDISISFLAGHDSVSHILCPLVSELNMSSSI